MENALLLPAFGPARGLDLQATLLGSRGGLERVTRQVAPASLSAWMIVFSFQEREDVHAKNEVLVLLL
jgi:hypothetical protein